MQTNKSVFGPREALLQAFDALIFTSGKKELTDFCERLEALKVTEPRVYFALFGNSVLSGLLNAALDERAMREEEHDFQLHLDTTPYIMA